MWGVIGSFAFNLLVALAIGLPGELPFASKLNRLLQGLPFEYAYPYGGYVHSLLLVIFTCFQLDYLRPPSELKGAYTDRQILALIRNRFVRVSVGNFLFYLLPITILSQLHYIIPIYQNNPDQSQFAAWLTISLGCMAMLLSFITAAVSLHLPGIHTWLRIQLAALLYLSVYYLSLLPFRIYLNAMKSGLYYERSIQLMETARIEYTLILLGALIVAAIIASWLPRRWAAV